MSIAYNGKLRRGLSDERFSRIITSLLTRNRTGLDHFRKKIDNENINSETIQLEDLDD